VETSAEGIAVVGMVAEEEVTDYGFANSYARFVPEGNQQRRQILLLQRQQEIHIPVRLQQLQEQFQEFRFCQIAHVILLLSKKK